MKDLWGNGLGFCVSRVIMCSGTMGGCYWVGAGCFIWGVVGDETGGVRDTGKVGDKMGMMCDSGCGGLGDG